MRNNEEMNAMTTLKSLLIAAESNLASYEADGDDRAISAGKIMVKGLEAAIDYEKIYLKKDEDSAWQTPQSMVLLGILRNEETDWCVNEVNPR